VRDLARLDRVVQARIDAALVRFTATGHGDVKSLKDRPGELRLRVGKWSMLGRTLPNGRGSDRSRERERASVVEQLFKRS